MIFLVNKQFFSLIVCSFGCFYHLFHVSLNFVSFKIRTEITYEYPKEVALPEIDIYVPMAHLLDLTSLYQRYPIEMAKLCSKYTGKINLTIENEKDFDYHCSNISQSTAMISEDLLSILTFGDIKNYTRDPRLNIKNSVYLLNDSKLDLLNLNICTVNRYFSGLSILMRISCRNGSEILTKIVDRSLMNNYQLICIFFDFDFKFGFRYSAAGSSLESRLGQYVKVEPEWGSFTFVNSRFRRLISEYLPWPYESMCKNYLRSATFVNCIDEHFLLSSAQKIYVDSVLPFDYYPPNFKFADAFRNAHDSAKFYNIFSECQKIIEQPECRSTIYTTSATIEYETYINKSICLCLESPLDPDTLYKVHPAYPFSEYIIYVSSITGIWFGLTVYGQLTTRLNVISLLSNEIIIKIEYKPNETLMKKMKITRIHPDSRSSVDKIFYPKQN